MLLTDIVHFLLLYYQNTFLHKMRRHSINPISKLYLGLEAPKFSLPHSMPRIIDYYQTVAIETFKLRASRSP